jgi:esterase/lipase
MCSGAVFSAPQKWGDVVTIEKLAESIFKQCEKDGEPVTMAEATEMAEMEMKANKNIKNYVESAENAEKVAKKSRKRAVSDEKKQIFTEVEQFLSENFDVSVEIPYKKMEIRLNGKTFTLDLIEKREKK